MSKHRIKPSKSVSKISFIVGIFFCLFGIGFIWTSLNIIGSPIMLPFALLWTAIAFFNTYRSYKNGFTDEGMAYYEIDSDDKNEEHSDFEDKLRKLNRLKNEGLISASEFKEKRDAIMAKDW